MLVTQAKSGHAIIVFQWSYENGICYDCGLPAAFYTGESKHAHAKRCAVCAANLAADGERVTRIRELV